MHFHTNRKRKIWKKALNLCFIFLKKESYIYLCVYFICFSVGWVVNGRWGIHNIDCPFRNIGLALKKKVNDTVNTVKEWHRIKDFYFGGWERFMCEYRLSERGRWEGKLKDKWKWTGCWKTWEDKRIIISHFPLYCLVVIH